MSLITSEAFDKLVEKHSTELNYIKSLVINPDNISHKVITGKNEFLNNYLQYLQNRYLHTFWDNTEYRVDDYPKMNVIHYSCSTGVFVTTLNEYTCATFFSSEYIEKCTNELREFIVNEMVKNNTLTYKFDNYNSSYYNVWEHIRFPLRNHFNIDDVYTEPTFTIKT